ncbi:MAG TPA: DUF930 domain-containing protein [Methylovirgula sp.]|jgi:hypothetical protein
MQTASSVWICFTIGIGLAAMATTTTFGLAIDPRAYAGLRRLDPDLRLEQVCDLEAMSRIKRETKFSPDRAKSYVVTAPVHEGDLLRADGAAFRSRGEWYRFSFTCKGTPDHLGVVAFSYVIGRLIPKSQWADYSLWR